MELNGRSPVRVRMQPPIPQTEPPPLDEWLDALQNEYEVLVQRLRHVDEVLVKHGRKKHYLLEKRIR